MKIQKHHKRTQCPCCKTSEILTLGLDQMCLQCDWDNSRLLVELGQMDHPLLAVFDQFVKRKSFDDIKDENHNKTIFDESVHHPVRNIRTA